MPSPGPTHSGSSFTGRSREIGIATHLIQEGLEGRLGLVRVAGPVGVGRRRFIAEVLRHGPDAEWVHLAQGGVEADFRRWVRTELHDLLDSYPSAPIPSWALHALSRWSATLSARAAVPALSREELPNREAPGILGSAIGAILHALTGSTLVVVDAGLWPRRGPAAKTIEALVHALGGPGAVVIAASESTDLAADPPDRRTLLLEPLDREAVHDLVERWGIIASTEALSAWLSRVTGGHPLFLHETVRWLEETGHVRVHEDERRVQFLDPVERLPIPLNLTSVLELRYRRLPPDAARLLALIAHHDGQEDTESLRERWDNDESFDEALAWLRRREFLYRRSTRRPLALASPLWRPLARGLTLRLPPVERTPLKPAAAGSPLAAELDRLEKLAASRPTGEERTALRRELARIARRAKGRPGAAWEGVRGRVFVLAARARLREGEPARAMLWVRWGLAHLDPEVHPALRRALAAAGAQGEELRGHPRRAQTLREAARQEAWGAGHLLAALRLASVVAEGARRLGELSRSAEVAFRAGQGTRAVGLTAARHLAEFTEIAALLDARELDAAGHALDAAPFAASGRALTSRLERLNSVSDRPDPVLSDPGAVPRGWGWGLDAETGWRAGLRRIDVTLSENPDGNASDEFLTRELRRAEETGLLGLALDLAETRLLLAARNQAGALRPEHLGDPARLMRQLGAWTRLRRLAELLRETAAAQNPLYLDLYAPRLLQAVNPSIPEDEPRVRLVLTGLPRLQHGARTWPRSLWPEWWAFLWGEAVSAAILGVCLDEKNLEARLRAAADLPRGPLENIVGQGNDVLRGPERVYGGIEIRNGSIGVEWSGLACDAHTIGTALETARTSPNAGITARARYREALDATEGAYLDGFDSPLVTRARSMLQAGITEALAACLDGTDPVSPQTLDVWVEGPMRLAGAGGETIVREFMNRIGRRRAALALRRGSP